ncbi:non-ribosomal peptide synthetase [Paraburkholderia megapolitana]|uniref:Amino acid adenylation domain-containing protein/thioester reductase domain-containing protein n=1 Tax=Paraburkholderia megapolitana TaxID=420953 RepID=A0A1I3TQ94_9BURK|nr:non-ribosomal peptide synthetase [Paraburkholderia megapolitana]QDQ83391.1 non-ribosomal peptide synthetase [Paraburkholderia megapolitana]SFJ73404.1 amino acid adenylation domain-containing protein/thioester reductase domain-containing protein [Paraburkholderia megapolitana]
MFIQIFQSHLSDSADRIAICSQDSNLTYGELNTQAESLALTLGANGVKPGQLVVLFMPRSPAIVMGMLAIMMAGGAYTVVEANGAPHEQLKQIADIDADFLIVSSELTHLAGETGLPWCTSHGAPADMRAPLESRLVPAPGDATAYVLFTSGSTGVPKGVAVSHDNLAHYCTGLIVRLGLPDGMTYAHVSTLSADLGNTCLFTALWTGGTLYLAGEHERKDPLAMVSALNRHRVNVLKITPTHWKSILAVAQAAGEHAPKLEWLILGGERLQTALARRTLESGVTRRLANHYGPTESTIGVTVQPVALAALGDDGDATVPIGRPFGRTTLKIRTAEGIFGTADIEGELYIGGPSVAQGYRNREEATRERFVELENSTGRYYRTGDWVRADGEGTITFLGRVDRQVKVNGYRVELEHVERAIRSKADIGHVVVVHHRHQEHDYLLCAYEGLAQEPAALRREMQHILPGYMIPVVFEHYASLPTNQNGKIDGGTIKQLLIDTFSRRHAPGAAYLASAHADDDLQTFITRVFRKYVGERCYSPDDNFFDLGADSLDAIQLIAELQLSGYPVSAHAFLERPTVRGVLAMIDGEQARTAPAPAPEETADRWPCSPAQQEFLKRGFAEPNRWNQAMVLELGVQLDPLVLERAFDRLVSEHALLRAGFHRDEALGQWYFRSQPTVDSILSICAAQEAPWSDLGPFVNERYGHLASQLDIESGQTFRAELSIIRGKQFLLLVGHHLAVDVISWRILLDDLMRHYSVLEGVEPATRAIRSCTFGQWCQHLETHQARLYADRNYWLEQPRQEPFSASHAGVEAHSGTAWIAFSAVETEALSKIAASQNMGIDRMLLAGFFEQCADARPDEVVQVDVESHGRLSLSPDVDVSRTIGWFTSTFPVAFERGQITSIGLASALHERLNRLPNLGHAYTLIDGMQHGTRSRYCFNFLGRQRLGLRNDWKMKLVSIELPSLRGAQNDRVYDLKLTGKIVDGQLILDLNFDASADTAPSIEQFVLNLKERILQPVDPGLRSSGPPRMHDANSSGALWNIPADIVSSNGADRKRRSYESIFVTGANGFIGIYALYELLLSTDAHIICLVRDSGDESAASRLFDAWSAFFDPNELESRWSRISVIAGDITQPCLGMSDVEWDMTSRSADAIYHFAADTRLVGSTTEMRASILHSTREIVRLAEQGRQKDLHFMSTLAVSGMCAGDEPRTFDEDSLDVGQTFFNEYERTKFDAEVLVRNFAYQGRSAFIYRSGNVTGHSETALFQRNATANRWVQCLRAIVTIGKAPRVYTERIILSPVDIVARGIVAISLDSNVSGGTFHVDSESAVPASMFIDSIEALGAPIERVDNANLAELFRHSGRLDHADIALGYFWAVRGSRNIRYDNSRTLAMLASSDIAFRPLDSAWVTRFVENLRQSGALAVGERRDPSRRISEFIAQ